jgi:hypothetical protein
MTPQPEAPSIISVKDAVTIARQYFESLNDQPLNNLRLEEVQLSEDESLWLVTLGYDTGNAIKEELERYVDPYESFVGSKQSIERMERAYKLISIRAVDGRPIQVKNVQL